MQQGGPPFGVFPPQHQQQPELSPFHLAGAAEAAPPISTRPPPPPGHGGTTGAPSYEELGAGDDPLGVPGDEGGSGGLSGNRWPRQETLALLKIRSDMDAAFRDATLKGPLWEEVSRKLGELGYRRSAKKCKEKFENVHKYYKRTKEGRAGRQDGKSYRFFSQLEALHNTTATNTTTLLLAAPQSMPTTPTSFAPNNQTPNPNQNQNQSGTAVTRAVHLMQISTPTPITTAPPPNPQPNPISMFLENPNVPGSTVGGAAAGIGFSSNTSSSSGSESEDDDDEATEEGPCTGRKRKRESGGGGSKKMMAFFEGLMRQVMERQESMQKRFLEAIEKREQDRMIREEAWRRQEMSRMAREHELAAQERAAAASRDAAIISFLQKVTGQTVQLPPPHVGVSSSPAMTVIQTPPNPPQPSQIHQTPPQPPPQQQQQQSTEAVPHHQPITPPPQPPPASSELLPVGSSGAQEGTMVNVSLDPASSRWPKSEVHALIKLRSELDSRYQESGPKGPLWEEISAGMQRLGYNRSAKRCKEKWENINKYFKKVKESNKKRPEDAKTCPYFHQLDALYRNKHHNSGGGGGSSGGGSMPALTHQNSNLNPNPSPITMIAPPQVQHQGEMESKNGNGGNADQNSGGSSNGGMGSNFFGGGTTTRGGGDNSGIMKKPEDIMKELMGHSTNDDYGNLNEPESDNMDEDDEEEDDEDDEDGKGQYRIQFQNVGNNNAGNGASPNTGGKTTGTFLAMVR